MFKKGGVFALLALGGMVWASGAEAQCCSGYDLATACSGVTLTKSRWCIQHTVPTGQSALPKAFCAYGEQVITTLEDVFGIQAKGVFEFELDTQTGGAHTGTACSNLGDGAAYDGFTGSAYGATDFWGYLLSMHEAINVWTGMSSSGWPTDWWADHQSAFPNLMDFHIMAKIGATNADANLTKAAAAQKARFYPGGDTADAKVVALDNVFAAMPNGDGFAGFSRLFALQKGDGVTWDNLGVPNPDVKRSEYVVAYMSLAAGKSLLTLVQGPGASGGGNICNGTQDAQKDPTYVCDQAHVDAIATAHCSIAANGSPPADLKSLRAGNYDAVPGGPCGSTCPIECACDSAGDCVAPWLGIAAATDAGSDGSTGDDAIDSGSTGTSGDDAGGTGGPGGSVGGALDAATRGSGSDDAGDLAASAPASDGGCSCQAVGGPIDPDTTGGLAATVLAAIGALRSRRRR
jgi:MYXO-CTERM domain-containing protein